RLCRLFYSLYVSLHHPPLPPFPPRRSSDLVDQRTLPRARHAGDDDEDAEGNVDVDVLQIVRRRVADLQLVGRLPDGVLELRPVVDRKSTRLNSSHVKISYAVFCLKKKKK